MLNIKKIKYLIFLINMHILNTDLFIEINVLNFKINKVI